MKKFTLAIIAVLTFAASCKKEDTNTSTTPTPTPTPTPSGPTAPTPTVGGSSNSGVLASIKMTYTTQPTGSPIPVDVTSEIASAAFYATAGSGTATDAGTVSVNTVNLDKNNNSYSKVATVGATPSTLNFGSGISSTSSWNVGGSSNVTAFTFDHVSNFPNYTGSVPSSVTKSSGVTLTFSTGTVTGADSVIVVIAAGSTQVTKTFAAAAGTVTIPSSSLSSLPTVSDNTAIFEVCPYNYVGINKNGKTYYFIKEQAVVKNININ